MVDLLHFLPSATHLATSGLMPPEPQKVQRRVVRQQVEEQEPELQRRRRAGARSRCRAALFPWHGLSGFEGFNIGVSQQR